MNILIKTNRLLLGLALPGMLFLAPATGFAETRDHKEPAVTIRSKSETQASIDTKKRYTHIDQWCKVLQAKGLCPSASGMCQSCWHVETHRGR